MKKTILFFAALAAIFMFSCSGNENKETDADDMQVIDDLSASSDELTVYSIPSPILVAQAMKMYEVDFNKEAIEPTGKSSDEFISIHSKAMNLGVSIVDLGYTSAFGQTQLSINYMQRIDNLLTELNIQNRESIFAMERFRENLANPDSIDKLIIEFQNKLDKYYVDEQADDVALLMVFGIYVEGLYLVLDSYNEIIDRKVTGGMTVSEGFKNLLMQQGIYADNIGTLLEPYKKEESKTIFEYIEKIKDQFRALDITYDIDDKTKKIRNINYKRDEIPNLKSLIKEVREYIITA
ncbi:MAG: hypothetical protein ABIJ16_01500 [Bacteroidota bacterium]